MRMGVCLIGNHFFCGYYTNCVPCFSHDENKANTSIACAENAKALGEGGAPEVIDTLLNEHGLPLFLSVFVCV